MPTTPPEDPTPSEPNQIPQPGPDLVPDVKEPPPSTPPDEVPNPNPEEPTDKPMKF